MVVIQLNVFPAIYHLDTSKPSAWSENLKPWRGISAHGDKPKHNLSTFNKLDAKNDNLPQPFDASTERTAFARKINAELPITRSSLILSYSDCYDYRLHTVVCCDGIHNGTLWKGWWLPPYFRLFNMSPMPHIRHARRQHHLQSSISTVLPQHSTLYFFSSRAQLY